MLNIFGDAEIPISASLKFRSSRPEVFCKEVLLRNFAKFTGKQPCQSLFFDKGANLFLVNF